MNIPKQLTFIFLFAGSLTHQNLKAQSVNDTSEKISKEVRIQQLAFDDSTRALAHVFVTKRTQLKKNLRLSYIVLVASGTLYVGGTLLFLEVAPEPLTGFVIVPLFIGASGIILGTGMVVINHIRFARYSLKKFEKIIADYKAGKPLPDFYTRKIYFTTR
ncbi:MAG: hypothetical protein JNM57_05580 [Cyclobacteriaceae bacterium]|nr:hypothetical protein [Cyclobacteriaceae bacterium]